MRPAPGAVAGVARMLLAFVAQIQSDRLQRGEALADDVLGRHHGFGDSGEAFFGGSSCT